MGSVTDSSQGTERRREAIFEGTVEALEVDGAFRVDESIGD